MRRHDDGSTGGGPLDDDLLDQTRVQRIQARERLVDYQQVGFVQQRGDELGLLLHPSAQVLHLLATAAPEVQALQPRAEAPPGLSLREPLQRRQVDEHLVQALVLVQPAVLGKIAHAVARPVRPRATEHLYRARVWRKDVQHHANSGRLAGPVGAQQAEHFAGAHLERDVANGLHVAEALAHSPHAHGNHGSPSRGSTIRANGSRGTRLRDQGHYTIAARTAAGPSSAPDERRGARAPRQLTRAAPWAMLPAHWTSGVAVPHGRYASGGAPQ